VRDNHHFRASKFKEVTAAVSVRRNRGDVTQKQKERNFPVMALETPGKEKSRQRLHLLLGKYGKYATEGLRKNKRKGSVCLNRTAQSPTGGPGFQTDKLEGEMS